MGNPQLNAEWQKKIAVAMLTHQKTRDEARTEQAGKGTGRGEKEAFPTHENEKHYADCLATIASHRERLREQQVRGNNAQ